MKNGKNAATLRNLLEKTRTKDFKGNHWGMRHVILWNSPRSQYTVALKNMIKGAAVYADAVRAATDGECGIMDDGVLGSHWRSILVSIHNLLNGELGGLDAGAVQEMLEAVAQNEGTTIYED